MTAVFDLNWLPWMIMGDIAAFAFCWRWYRLNVLARYARSRRRNRRKL